MGASLALCIRKDFSPFKECNLSASMETTQIDLHTQQRLSSRNASLYGAAVRVERYLSLDKLS